MREIKSCKRIYFRNFKFGTISVQIKVEELQPRSQDFSLEGGRGAPPTFKGTRLEGLQFSSGKRITNPDIAGFHVTSSSFSKITNSQFSRSFRFMRYKSPSVPVGALRMGTNMASPHKAL